MGSLDEPQGAISLELLFDTLGMNEITQGERVKGRDTGLGLFASVQRRVACALIVPINAACCWGPFTIQLRPRRSNKMRGTRTPERHRDDTRRGSSMG